MLMKNCMLFALLLKWLNSGLILVSDYPYLDLWPKKVCVGGGDSESQFCLILRLGPSFYFLPTKKYLE